MRRTLVPLSLLLALAAGCSSDGPSGPTSEPLDVAPLLAEMSLPSITDAASGLTAGLVPVLPVAATADSCPYDAASRSFVCAPVTRSGLTLTFAYTLLDAAGNPQSRGDRATTAAIRTLSTVSGTTSLAGSGGGTPGLGGTLTTTQRQELTLSGLLGTRRVLDGTMTGRIEGTVTERGISLPVRVTMTQTVAGVVLPTGGAGAARWPAGGTITIDMTAIVGPGAESTLRMVMAFDGTSTVTITLTADGMTERCTLNLARPQDEPVCTG